MTASPRHVRRIGYHADPAAQPDPGRVEGVLRACGAGLEPISALNSFAFLAPGETRGLEAAGEIEIAVLETSFRQGGEIRVWSAEIRAGTELAGPLYWRPGAPGGAARTETLALRANAAMAGGSLAVLIAMILIGEMSLLGSETRALRWALVWVLALVCAAQISVISCLFGESHRQSRRRLPDAPVASLSVSTPARDRVTAS